MDQVNKNLSESYKKQIEDILTSTSNGISAKLLEELRKNWVEKENQFQGYFDKIEDYYLSNVNSLNESEEKIKNINELIGGLKDYSNDLSEMQGRIVDSISSMDKEINESYALLPDKLESMKNNINGITKNITDFSNGLANLKKLPELDNNLSALIQDTQRLIVSSQNGFADAQSNLEKVEAGLNKRLDNTQSRLSTEMETVTKKLGELENIQVTNHNAAQKILEEQIITLLNDQQQNQKGMEKRIGEYFAVLLFIQILFWVISYVI
jgi:chromosome segregation ATPase